MTVQKMLKKYPQSSFNLMTPGGFVFLAPKSAKELLSDKTVTGHPGVSEYARIVNADELLNQEVISSSYNDNTWYILCNFPQMEQDQLDLNRE